jgi:subtilisin family serine protease
METKTYIVVLHSDVDYDAFWHEIESVTNGLSCVPDRPVSIVNNRSMFKKICEYSLTNAEAENLKNDPRVAAVEIPVRDLPYVQVTTDIVQNASQIGPAPGMNFNKQPGNVTVRNPRDPLRYDLPYGASINWGLIRHINQGNPYGVNATGANTAGLNTSQNYAYALDGTGVDVIINDTGIQVNHPEFTNATGQSRVVRVDWNNIAGQLGIPVNFNIPNVGVRSWNTLSYSDTGTDIDSHGTHVAGIAVGKTYGWAKNSNIISLSALTRGQSSADPLDTFEMMMRWHQTKGNRNPTVVNMSWGIDLRFPKPFDILNFDDYYYLLISGGSYRGTPILPGQSFSYYQQRGLIPLSGNGFPVTGPSLPGFPYTSVAYDMALGELIDSGIIVVKAAGNSSFKMDKPNNQGGSGDYNNFINIEGIPGTLWYHRGPSPMDRRAIVVGALDTLTSNTRQDQKVPFSCAGPRVDVYAAGTYIMSAGPSQPNLGALYFLNQPGQNFKELVGSGTSQAAPQIAGMAALYLQAHKPANIYSANNCSNVQSWITTNSTTNTFFQTGNATSYTNYLSLLGGDPRVAYQPLQGITYAQNNGWKQVANVYVRGTSSWEPVRAAWTKTAAGWIQIF